MLIVLKMLRGCKYLWKNMNVLGYLDIEAELEANF